MEENERIIRCEVCSGCRAVSFAPSIERQVREPPERRCRLHCIRAHRPLDRNDGRQQVTLEDQLAIRHAAEVVLDETKLGVEVCRIVRRRIDDGGVCQRGIESSVPGRTAVIVDRELDHDPEEADRVDGCDRRRSGGPVWGQRTGWVEANGALSHRRRRQSERQEAEDDYGVFTSR